jgi:hypothetical protein
LLTGFSFFTGGLTPEHLVRKAKDFTNGFHQYLRTQYSPEEVSLVLDELFNQTAAEVLLPLLHENGFEATPEDISQFLRESNCRENDDEEQKDIDACRRIKIVEELTGREVPPTPEIN